MKNHILDQVEAIIKEKFKGQEVEFKQILTAIKETLKKNSSGDIERESAEIYTDMTMDPRFVNVGRNMWKLRDFVSFEDYKKNKSSMFGLKHANDLEAKEVRGSEVELVENDIEEELNPQIDDSESMD